MPSVLRHAHLSLSSLPDLDAISAVDVSLEKESEQKEGKGARPYQDAVRRGRRFLP